MPGWGEVRGPLRNKVLDAGNVATWREQSAGGTLSDPSSSQTPPRGQDSAAQSSPFHRSEWGRFLTTHVLCGETGPRELPGESVGVLPTGPQCPEPGSGECPSGVCSEDNTELGASSKDLRRRSSCPHLLNGGLLRHVVHHTHHICLWEKGGGGVA